MFKEIRKKNFWVVSQLFYPDETSTGFLMTKIAEKIVETENVQVICGPANYQSGALSTLGEIDERIKIIRVKIPTWSKNNIFLRLSSFIIFTVSVSWKILFNVKKNNRLILVTNPPLLILFISIIKWLKHFKVIIIVHDVFPENLAAAGIIKANSFTYRVMQKLFNFSYNNVDHIIVCGEDMKKIFLSKVKKEIPITVITNWADHQEVFGLPSFNSCTYYQRNDLSKKIIIQFAGNIGRVQGLEKFLEVFIRINNENLFLVIIGDGAFKTKLERIQISADAKNILFLPSKPRTEQNNFINACDIGLVTLAPGMLGLGVPSKVYNIFSASKPVLYIGDYNSEIYKYVSEYNVGWAFTWNNTIEIEQFLKNLNRIEKVQLKIKGSAARKLVEDQFTKDYVLNKYKAILQ